MKKLFILTLFVVSTAINMYAGTLPAKPSRNQIARDLVGQTLKEGYKDGWFSEGWHWDVKDGQIKALKIIKVLKDTKEDYCVVVKIRLQGEVNAFNAQVKVNYHLTQNKRWKLEYALSLGMDIVRTHKYDDCLTFSIVEDGWGGTYMLKITNGSNIELGCAGWIKANGEWTKFAVRIDPHKSGGVGGLLDGGGVKDYKIEFIERP